MEAQKVAKASVPQRRTRTKPRTPLTLADVTISWEVGDRTRTVSGRQLAYLITTAAERCPADQHIGGGQAARWIYRLRGMSALTYPDPGVSIYEDDARALVADLVQGAAADIIARELDDDDWPRRFRVTVRR